MIVEILNHWIKYPVPNHIIQQVDRPDWVYVIKNERTGLTKIGITNDLERRMQEHRRDKTQSITLLLAIKMECGYDESAEFTEKHLHKFFKHKRMFGEWFDLSKWDIARLIALWWHIGGEYYCGSAIKI